MLTIRAMSDGTGYSARHLEHSDYYAEGEGVTGVWRGRGAELLGLSGEVKAEQFEAVREGLDPESGTFLRQRHNADRLASDGTMQSRGRNLYDFTISAPKSVSIMAELGGDDRLGEAHRKAVDVALGELEDRAASRVRQLGANENRTTGNLVLAVYHHDTSRELDPQLHTHAVAANLTYDGTEGRWKALQASEIYEQRAYLTEVYRNALASEVRSLGYEIENKRDQKGKDLGFEIKGVSQELLDRYSQRSQQRDQAIEEFTRQNGRRPTDNEVAVLVRESRADKLTEISTEEVQARQRERLSLGQSETLAHIHEAAYSRSQTIDPELQSAARSLDYAEQHVFERVSVARDYELLTEALRHGRGQIDLGELKGNLSLQESNSTVLRAGGEVATRESLERERQMIQRVNRGMRRFERLGGTQEFTVSPRLNPEQRRVVEFVLHSHDLAVNIRGAAGTGKTATLQELHRGLQHGGHEVLAVAPTMSAVEELHKVGFSQAITVKRLLQDQNTCSDMSDKVLVVDEAGMVSGRQMSELLKLAEEQSVRIVFSGDTRQIRSVEASDALRILEKESSLQSISLTQVQRQSVSEYRHAIQELRHDPESGFDKLEAMGTIREVPFDNRAHAVQQAYMEARSQLNGKELPREVLVVAATHEEIDSITQAIRVERIKTGELGDSVSTERHVALNWTTAQKNDFRNYQEGQILKFHRPVKGVAKHESLEVERVEEGRIIARNSKGEERQFTTKQVKAFDVYERRFIEIAPRDKLLLLANQRGPEFHATNGELVTVFRLDEHRRIHLQDGRILPEAYKQFTHGYAITAHRSQGKSVDAVIISGDGMRRELFYVAASRGREQITVVTSDKKRLRESITHSGVRQSASELNRKRQELVPERDQTVSTQRERPASERLSVRDLVREVTGEEPQPNRKAPAHETTPNLEPQKPTDQKHQYIIEPGNYSGMER